MTQQQEIDVLVAALQAILAVDRLTAEPYAVACAKIAREALAKRSTGIPHERQSVV